MKMTFIGWKREVYPHKHEVYPVDAPAKPTVLRSRNKKKFGTINIGPDNVALGRIDDVSLSGEFLVEFMLEENELTTWIRNKIKRDPVYAAKELGTLYNEAINAAFESLKGSANDSDTDGPVEK